MTLHTESEERLEHPLIKLAHAYGVATSYTGQQGEFIEIDDDVLIKVLKALNVEVANDAEATQALHDFAQASYSRLSHKTLLHIYSQESRVEVHHGVREIPTATLILEDGSTYPHAIECVPPSQPEAHPTDFGFKATSNLVIPADVPLGYHTLHITAGEESCDAFLICAPKKVELINELKNGRLWGWMAQLYSVRSHESWGIGDFEDLRNIVVEARKTTGADFVQINPTHAGEPVLPLTPSPYLPVSRRYVNFTYIRPESIPEYSALNAEDKAKVDELRNKARALNDDADYIDRDAMWSYKMPALWTIYSQGRSDARQNQFIAFKQDQGEDLHAYAVWCLAYDKWGAPTAEPDSWQKKYNRDSDEIKQLCARFPDTLDFYSWLEWIAFEQLEDAQKAARDAGMPIGIMSDMAVGVHPDGCEVWWNPERFARGATVGAPPDFYNQQGQNWSQPPFSPVNLEETGYATYRNMVAGMFEKAGAVRIDHILGLFRLWWIPEGNSAKSGAYVHYNSDIMLGILALEANRAHGTVIGEDLGVVPPYVAGALTDHAVLGCAIEWYEVMNGVFTPPQKWREYAMASAMTHDMPPNPGYLNYEQVKIREELGLLTDSVEEFQKEAEEEHYNLMKMLVAQGFVEVDWIKTKAAEAEHEEDIIAGMHKALCASPCKLITASFADAVGERRAQNQPGTNNEYPNWRIPLADGEKNIVYANDLFTNERLLNLGRVMNSIHK